MANWEYKVLSSGKHGMATMAALEQHLNDLGQQQWEIITWHTVPDNPLLFSGLARRPILRDWKPDEMPAAVAAAREKAEDEKERSAWRDTLKEELEFITERDNEIEDDPVADTEDLLDMLIPLMRRSQRGPGSVGAISFLARKFNQAEEDLLGALAEAGLTLSEDPSAVPASIEHDGDFFWLNRNARGEVWLNSGPRAPSAKPVQEPRAERPARDDRRADAGVEGDNVSPADDSEAPAAEGDETAAPADGAAPAPARDRDQGRGQDRGRGRDRDQGRDQNRNRDRGQGQNNQPQGEPKPLPEGEELLARLRPMMRRNRRGRGLSGSISYLSRALRQSDAALTEALAKLGLILPDDPQAKPIFVEIANLLYWLNKGQGGQIWINTREMRAGETAESARADEETTSGEPAAASTESAPAPAVENQSGEPAAPSAAPAAEAAPASEPVAVAESSDAPAATSESAPAEAEGEPAFAASGDSSNIFDRVRPHFSKNKRSAAFSAAPGAVAEALGMSQVDLVESLVKAGLEVPEREDSKPVYVENNGGIFWFNRNAKDELWLNAKAKTARKSRSGGRSAGAKKKDGDDEAAGSDAE